MVFDIGFQSSKTSIHEFKVFEFSIMEIVAVVCSEQREHCLVAFQGLLVEDIVVVFDQVIGCWDLCLTWSVE